MTWHEMQNRVCSERCMCVFIPPTMQRAGSTHRPMKATIFQPVALRQRRPNQKNRGQYDAQYNLTNENPNHRASFCSLREPRRSAFPSQNAHYFFANRADVGDESLDLVVRQLALVRGHLLALAVGDAVGELRVRLVLHVRANIRSRTFKAFPVAVLPLHPQRGMRRTSPCRCSPHHPRALRRRNKTRSQARIISFAQFEA